MRQQAARPFVHAIEGDQGIGGGMSELRALLEFVTSHRIPWYVAALISLYLVLRRVAPWLANRFEITDRHTMQLLESALSENAQLRTELKDARETLQQVREELIASKAVPSPNGDREQ